jgi:hypothetical protein
VLEGLAAGMAVVIEFVLAFLQASAPLGKLAHATGDHLLALVPADGVQLLAHQVIEGGRDLVHHHGG